MAFFYLGLWQWRKGDLRHAQWDRFAQGSDHVVPLGSGSVAAIERFQRISLEGRFDVEHQFLLDNRTHEGRAGFEVLTPLRRPSGATVLIDRGWVPFSGVRARLPDVAFKPSAAQAGSTGFRSSDDVELTGRVADLPSPGLASGRAPPVAGPWPKLTSFPSMGQLSAALGTELEPRIVLLDPQAADGYVRDWHPPGLQPLRHWSYAVQWWCFAVVLLMLWVGLNIRKVAADR